jgi:F0F1-type ATP synthase membrane subunit b/b'
MMAGKSVYDIFPVFKNLRNPGSIQILQQPVRVIYIPAKCWLALIWILKFIINQNNLIKKSCQAKELKKLMTDNLKVKASKAVDDARVAAHAAYDDATVAAHNSLKDARVDAQKVSDDVKIGVHKAVSDAKIAAHEAGSKLKKH